MWPWGHLAVGYLVYVVGRRRSLTAPGGGQTLALLFGTQFPDLVDKPLAWTLGVLTHGRSLGHSAIVAALVLGVLVGVARRANRGGLVGPFAVGYLSHLASDGLYPALAGDWAALAYLGWPLLAMPEPDANRSILRFVLSVEPTSTVLVETGLFLLALLIWHRQGHPGAAALRGRLAGAVRAVW